MKQKKILLSFFAVLLFSGVGMAQNKQQRRWVTKHYDLVKLRQFSQDQYELYQTQRDNALRYAKAHNLPLVIEKENGSKSYLSRMNRRGELIYITTSSIEGSETINTEPLYPDGELGLEIDGDGMTVGVWDGGKVRKTHQLLDGKVTQGDHPDDYSDHSTHVAGIVAGKKLPLGDGKKSIGTAYNADIIAYDWNADISEMTNEAANGLLVSNHSYGMDLSLDGVDPENFMGYYDHTSSAVDELAAQAPYYTIVTAAGNDRDLNYNPGGYEILGGEMTTAKNTIVVAAIKYMPYYNDTNSPQMSSFSSWGPTNDRRIKPDISADGVQVMSSIATSDNAYARLSGTSMAAPSVAGGVILLQQLYSDLHNDQFLLSSSIKALIIQTAREAGINPGPDPRFGWGVMNVGSAAKLLIDAKADEGTYIEEPQLTNSDNTYTKKVTASGDGDLKVTIAWTDPKAAAQNLGNHSSRLVNDLDLKITKDNNVYYPWRLDSGNSSPALNDDENHVDNVEQVVVENAVAGQEYTITVDFDGVVLMGGKQDFSIVISGMQGGMSVSSHKLENYSLYPNPANNSFNLELKESCQYLNVQVYGLNGRVLINENYKDPDLNHNIDVSGLSSGIYFVKINADGKTNTEKLIVK